MSNDVLRLATYPHATRRQFVRQTPTSRRAAYAGVLFADRVEASERQRVRKVADEIGLPDAVLAAVGTRHPVTLRTVVAKTWLPVELVRAILGSLVHHRFIHQVSAGRWLKLRSR